MRAHNKAAVGTALALLLAGCSFNAAPSLKAPRSPAETGGELTVGISRPSSIDPATASDPSGQLVVETMCDSLLEFDPETGELAAGLAKSFISPATTSFTVTLKTGLRFNNGQKVKIEDVLFSLSRVVAEASPGVAELLEPINGYRFVHGDAQVEDPEDPAAERLSGVRRLTPTSFQIELSSPMPEFAHRLALPLAAVVPNELAGMTPQEFARRPICVGPYQLEEEYTPQSPVVSLTRADAHAAVNEAYTRGGAGYADRIRFVIHPDRQAQMQAFARGQLDVAQVSPDKLAAARLDHPEHLVQAATADVEYVGVPYSEPAGPLNDPRVRQALSLALDRTAIVARVYDGGRLAADGLLPPAATPAGSHQRCPAVSPTSDVTRARQFLEDAAVDLGQVPHKLYFNDEFRHRALMEEVALQWRNALGLRSELVPLSWPEFASAGTSATGFGGPFRFAWTSPVPGRVDYLDALFAGNRIGDSNLSRFASPLFNRALERQVLEEDNPVDREIVADALVQQVCLELPLIPLTFGATEYLVRRERVASAVGTFTDFSSGRPALRELFLEEA